MIVVADTTPLNYLIRLDLSNILREVYGRVLVPSAVLVEMQHPEAPDEVRAWATTPPNWIEQAQVRHLDETLAADLGPGERAAISLAMEVDADILLMDEFAGRQAAQARQIHVAGTLAVLLKASLLGHCEFPQVMQSLRGLGFRVSRQVEAHMLARYTQAKNSGS